MEQSLEDIYLGAKTAQTLEAVARSIAEDLKKVPVGGKILLPGGWHNKDGGHAMVYQFMRGPEGYHFTVFNSGDGLKYHAKKSTAHKELYNPTKTWRFPIPETSKGQLEVALFIERLLKVRLSDVAEHDIKAMSAEILYREILPSISYIQGVETDANDGFPEYGYTGGQLSGTCAQRCIHQMLKVNSKSEEDFKRFIFTFKVYAVYDYAQGSFSGKQPFNQGVAQQIFLL